MDLSRPKLKKPKSENKKCHAFCLFRENFSNISTKLSYTFRYKEVKFSKFKYFPITIIKCFFSFYTQQTFVFHLL